MGKRANGRRIRATHAKLNLAHTIGLQLYFLYATSGAAAFYFAAITAFFYFFNPQGQSYYIAAGAGALAFVLVMYALQKNYSEHLPSPIRELDRTHLIGHIDEWRKTYSLLSILPIIFLMTLSVGHAPTAGTAAVTRPTSESVRAIQDAERSMQEVIMHAIGPSASDTSERRDVCELGEQFSLIQLGDCLKDIQKHPNRKGVGGPDLVIKKLDGKLKLKAGRRIVPGPPLDLRPRTR